MKDQEVKCYCCSKSLGKGTFVGTENFWAICQPCIQDIARKSVYLTITGQGSQLVKDFVDESTFQEFCKEGGLA